MTVTSYQTASAFRGALSDNHSVDHFQLCKFFGIAEGLHQGLTVAVFPGMGPHFVIFSQPFIPTGVGMTQTCQRQL